MVNERLHIICGNCGQDLKATGMAKWEYVPAEYDEDGELYSDDDVIIHCENCSTLHFMSNYINKQNEEEQT